MALYNHSPAAENLSLRLKPVWEAEGQTAYAGTPALIIAASTSLGQFGTLISFPISWPPLIHTFSPAIQLARLAGHNPIIATASLHNAPLLKSLGATHVLDRSRTKESILAELPALLGGKPLEFVFVALIDADSLRLGRDALAPGGALATVAANPTQIPEDVANPGEGKRIGYSFGSARLPCNRETGLALFKQIGGWLEKGEIQVRRSLPYGFGYDVANLFFT